MGPGNRFTKGAKQLNAEAKRLCEAVWHNLDLFDQNYSKAIDLLKKARKIEAENVAVLTNLGAALSDSGNHREALEVLRQAEAIGSEDRNLYFNIAVAMMNISAATRSGAGEYFARASRLRPQKTTFEAYFDPHGY